MFKTCVCFAANSQFGTTSGGFNIAQELEAWNLHAEQASPWLLYALSLARSGSSTTGIGGLPLRAGDGSFLRSSAADAGPASSARSSAVRIMLLRECDLSGGSVNCQ